MNKKNFHITNKKGPGYFEQTEQGCTTCIGLPDYHYFTHGYYRDIVLSVSSYTLEKKRNHIIMNNTEDIFHNMSRSKQLISHIKWKFLRVLYRILWLQKIKKMVKPKIIYSLHHIGIYDLVKRILRKSNNPTSGGY